MGAAREKDSADFDLEAFIELFDEALTSDDPSVQKTLQHLMVIAALARNHDGHSKRSGPLRRLYDDQHNIIRRLEQLENNHSKFKPGFGPVPHVQPTPVTWPSTTTQWPPIPGTYPPGTIFAQNLSASSVTPPGSGAQSATGYAQDPLLSKSIAKKINGGLIAERVEELLKDGKYKGSSVGGVDVKIA
jgi:hypothetical protein